MRRANVKGQGALEYLLLIGGGVLVATVVLLIVLNSVVPGTNDIINSNIGQYQNQISLGTGTGGGPSCDNDNIQESGEACDGTDLSGETCVTLGYTGGSLSCSASCTFVTTSCTGTPPAPNITSFSANTTSTDLFEMNLVYTTTGTVTAIDGCYGANLASVTSTTLATFQTQCTSAGGTNVAGMPTTGPDTLTLSNSNTAYDFAIIACNGVSCDTDNSATGTTLGMASFFSFDWTTMSTVQFNGTGNTADRSMGWSFSNTSGSGNLVVDSITPTFTYGGVTLQSVGTNTGPLFSGSLASGVQSSTGLGYSIAPGTVSGAANTFIYSGAVHTFANSNARMTFNFLDGTSSTTLRQYDVLALEDSASGSCAGAAGTTYDTLTNNPSATDYTAGGADRGMVEHWTMSVPSGATALNYATLSYYVSAPPAGSPANYEYFIPLTPGALSAASCTAIGMDGVLESGVTTPGAVQVSLMLPDLLAGYHDFDVESFHSLAQTDWYYGTTGEDVAAVTGNARAYSTNNAGASFVPKLMVGYVAP